MSVQRSLCLVLFAGLLCGAALAEPQKASDEISQGVIPMVDPPVPASSDVIKGIPDQPIPEIFPQVASDVVATQPTQEMVPLPGTGTVQTEAATHPQAHESAPLLPTTLTSGWMLMGVASSPKPIPFMDTPGYRATYQLPGKDGVPQSFIADILMIASEAEAIEAYDLLSRDDSLATRTETLEIPGLKKIQFREGAQESPAASAGATAVKAIRISAWFPPFVVLFQGQNVDLGVGEVKDILSSLSWRE